MARLPVLPALILAAAAARAAGAAEPITFGRLSLSFGGEGSGTLAPEDRGYFNYTDYQFSTLRLLRLSASVELKVGEHLAALGEVRSDNLEAPRAYALYLRFRPWRERSFDVQAGLIPQVFGAFPRHRYGAGNLMVGYPLAYQYLTSLRADAVPTSADQLAFYRGRGWYVYYPLGSPEPGPGLPLVNAQRWDAGVQLRLGTGPLEVAAALTQGTLSNPRVRDDNKGKQFATRASWRPRVGLVIGASAARGVFLEENVRATLPPEEAARDYRQWAGGLDVEYSRGHWLVRAEAVASGWDMPRLGSPPVPGRLGALGLMLEGRRKLRPGLYVAARADHLGFSRMDTSFGRLTWDANVSRLEGVVGYSPHRHVQIKAAYQYNWRDGGFIVHRDGLAAGQVLLWY